MSTNSVSNWFSSLRRQPKNKKHPDKLKQKSCLDLTSADGNLITPPPSVNENSIEKVMVQKINPKDVNICSKCSCQFPSKLNIKSTVTGTFDTESKTEKSIKTDELKKFEELNGKTVYSVNKRQDFKTTTTTLITRTTILNKTNRIGFVFNENSPDVLTTLGNYNIDLVNKFNWKNRDGLVFDEHGDIMNSTHDILASLNNNLNNNNINSKSDKNLKINSSTNDDDDFEFIDSSSVNEIHNRESPKLCPNCKNKFISKSDWNLNKNNEVTYNIIISYNLIYIQSLLKTFTTASICGSEGETCQS